MEKTELKELHWSTDREQIESILHHLNPKYLLGRLEAHDTNRNSVRECEDRQNNKKYAVRINYDGCTFTASKKTLEAECWRRVKEGKMEAYKDYKLWRSRSRFVRFCDVHKDGKRVFAKYVKI